MGNGQPIAVDLEVSRLAASRGRDISKDRRQVQGRRVNFGSHVLCGEEKQLEGRSNHGGLRQGGIEVSHWRSRAYRGRSWAQ